MCTYVNEILMGKVRSYFIRNFYLDKSFAHLRLIGVGGNETLVTRGSWMRPAILVICFRAFAFRFMPVSKRHLG